MAKVNSKRSIQLGKIVKSEKVDTDKLKKSIEAKEALIAGRDAGFVNKKK